MTAHRAPTDDAIQAALVENVKEIQTPHGDPIAAELLSDVSVAAGLATLTVDLTGLPTSIANRVGEQLRGAALSVEGIDHVRVQAADRRSADGDLQPRGVDAIVAVGGAKGGAGKSTLTVALAEALDEAGLSVGIFDADFEASDLIELLDPDGPIQATPGGNPAPVVVDGIQYVSVELVSGDLPASWRGAVVSDVLGDLLGDAVWNDRDVLLVDLPPGVGDVAYTIVEELPLDGAVLATTPTDLGIRANRRMASLLDGSDVPLIEVLANKDGYPADAEDAGAPYGADAEAVPSDLFGPFGEAADDVDDDEDVETPPIVSVPFDPGLQHRSPRILDGAAPETEAAVDDAATVLREFLAGRTSAVPEDALDLRGFPDRLREQEATIEFGSAPDGPRPLVVEEADDLPEILEDALADAHDDPTVTVSDAGAEGQVLSLDQASG